MNKATPLSQALREIEAQKIQLLELESLAKAIPLTKAQHDEVFVLQMYLVAANKEMPTAYEAAVRNARKRFERGDY